MIIVYTFLTTIYLITFYLKILEAIWFSYRIGLFKKIPDFYRVCKDFFYLGFVVVHWTQFRNIIFLSDLFVLLEYYYSVLYILVLLEYYYSVLYIFVLLEYSYSVLYIFVLLEYYYSDSVLYIILNVVFY